MCQVMYFISLFYESIVKILVAEFTSFFERNPFYVAMQILRIFRKTKIGGFSKDCFNNPPDFLANTHYGR
jgi:hypothetical protein